ncbi:MAG TPA: hypothetical protein VI078_10165 [bacterium]
MSHRTGVFLCCILAALLAAGAAGAQAAPVVRVTLGQGSVYGEGWPAFTEIEATLRDAGGAVKGACLVQTDTGGNFLCSWGQSSFGIASLLPPAVNLPGDSLSVEQGGATYASGPFPVVRITDLDPATDRVAGTITPRRATARIRFMRSPRLTSTGYVIPAILTASVTTGADGAFAVDLTSLGNAIRNDRLFVSQVQGRFEIGVNASFPGLNVQKDGSAGFLSGVPDSVHTVRLFSAAGALKSVATVTVGGGGAGPAALARGEGATTELMAIGVTGYFSFKDAAGRPVRIVEGDLIAVGAPLAFGFRVPKLSPGMSAERFTVRTLPNRPLYFSGQIFAGPGVTPIYLSAYGQSNSTGYYQYNPVQTITSFSSCSFSIVVDGNYVSTSRMLAP